MKGCAVFLLFVAVQRQRKKINASEHGLKGRNLGLSGVQGGDISHKIKFEIGERAFEDFVNCVKEVADGFHVFKVVGCFLCCGVILLCDVRIGRVKISWLSYS